MNQAFRQWWDSYAMIPLFDSKGGCEIAERLLIDLYQ